MATTTKRSADTLLQLIKQRRTYYPLSKDLGSVTAARVQELVNETVLHTPSSFNSQSTRTVILLGAEHDKLWDMTTALLRPMVTDESKWEQTSARMNMFKGAAGTIMFFDDQTVVESMQSKFALYADKFPGWATQSNGMHQYLLWNLLELEGLGANLQHYNPVIDEKVAQTWKLPATWKLNAQLVFGGRTAEPAEKTFQPLEERVKIFGA